MRVIDGTGAPPQDDRTLIIENGKISAVQPAAGRCRRAPVQGDPDPVINAFKTLPRTGRWFRLLHQIKMPAFSHLVGGKQAFNSEFLRGNGGRRAHGGDH